MAKSKLGGSNKSWGPVIVVDHATGDMRASCEHCTFARLNFCAFEKPYRLLNDDDSTPEYCSMLAETLAEARDMLERGK